MQSIIETIKMRHSCRTYNACPVEPDIRNRLRNVLASQKNGPFGNLLRFQLLDLSELERRELRSLGTYGVIKGATLFMVGTVSKGARAMEDYGYGMEHNILAATALGLGTCWLGGTFNKGGFTRRLNVTADELLPAISPVGYARERRSLTDSLFRFMAASHTRKPWQELFFAERFDSVLDPDQAGDYVIPLECVRIGPSASNKQPWRILREQEPLRFHFFLERTKGYETLSQDIHLQNVDMGIAACHFELSAREQGLSGMWQDTPPATTPASWEYITSWAATG